MFFDAPHPGDVLNGHTQGPSLLIGLTAEALFCRQGDPHPQEGQRSRTTDPQLTRSVVTGCREPQPRGFLTVAVTRDERALRGEPAVKSGSRGWLLAACAVKGGAFQWVRGPPGESLQPEAIGAVMEVTKWLKPSISGHNW